MFVKLILKLSSLLGVKSTWRNFQNYRLVTASNLRFQSYLTQSKRAAPERRASQWEWNGQSARSSGSLKSRQSLTSTHSGCLTDSGSWRASWRRACSQPIRMYRVWPSSKLCSFIAMLVQAASKLHITACWLGVF